jgi:aminoglycoside/choline kinase family phosphotransferase
MNRDRSAEACAFLAEAGWRDAELVALRGDASTRRYYRVWHQGRSAMLMDQPQSAEAPACPPSATADERRALGYNAVARLAGANCARFIAAANYLRERGLAAPQIYAANVAEGFVLLEDFGDDLYADALGNGADELALYRAATDAIARLHAQPAPRLIAGDMPLYHYDVQAQLAETDLMTEWFVPLALGRSAAPDEVSEHRALWREALTSICAPDSVFVHRDYHAQNLFWLAERQGLARVGMIDFQDALAGNRSYDLISLVEDARRDVAPELAAAMQERYLAAANADGHVLDEEAFRAESAVTAAQRNAKIAGIFARLANRDGKRRYLSFVPRVWRYLERDLSHPALAKLRAWYDRAIPAEARSGMEMA